MVCCFAAVQYTGCGHRQVFKIDCTRDCTSRCQPQELLLETRACFPCERCLGAQADKKTRERALASTLAKLAALETQESQEGLPSHTRSQYTQRSRDEWDGECASAKLEARLYEASFAENWTFEAAELVWQLKYGGCEDVKAVERKLDKQMALKPWDVQVFKKSNWTDDTVDSPINRVTNNDSDFIESGSRTNAATATAGRKTSAENESVRLGADASAASTGSTQIAGQVSMAILVCIAAVAPDADSDRAARVEYVNVAAVFQLGADSSNFDRSRVITKVGDVSIIAGVNIASILAAGAASDPNKGLTTVLF